MAMRVIAGEFRHRTLKYPVDNKLIRPTKDRIKEAFFSIVGDLNGKVFLDLCAGCGGMGIEAISRGAKEAVFVENNRDSLGFIKDNLCSLGINNYQIFNKDIFIALEEIKNKNYKFDVIYFDPPYDADFYTSILSYIYNNDILTPQGVLAFEANKKIDIIGFGDFKIKEYHYGEITVTVIRK